MSKEVILSKEAKEKISKAMKDIWAKRKKKAKKEKEDKIKSC